MVINMGTDETGQKIENKQMGTNQSNVQWHNGIGERELNWVTSRLINGSAIHNIQPANMISNWPITREDKIKFIEQHNTQNLVKEFKSDTLSESEFEWINDKDERQCYWIWTNIKDKLGHIQLMNDHPLLQIPFNAKERLKQIIFILDNHAFPANPQEISNHAFRQMELNTLRNQWSNIYRNQKLHQWLDQNNEAQLDWAWDYFTNNNIHGLHTFNIPAIPICNLHDKYLTLIAEIDSKFLKESNTGTANLQFIIDKAKRAWSQKKHRDKRGDKKSFNFVLPIETKEKLNEIAVNKDQKINETLEKLINKAHSEIDW